MVSIVNSIFLLILLLLVPPFIYLYTLAISSIHSRKAIKITITRPAARFIITIPAHNEENVIVETIRRLKLMNYPSDLFKICVIADHCTDGTASLARQSGAIVFDRIEGERGMKSDALSWFFQQIPTENDFDAVIIFDADTHVDENFLQVMNGRLAQGDQVIQGQHIISNYKDGWFPCLTWAMFLIDNRYQNLGRSNLGLSAKNMGDSICFRESVLGEFNNNNGLTEDYQLRQKLLLKKVRIAYEPKAIGYGEAPQTWHQAKSQRVRWLKGTREASRAFRSNLLNEFFKHPDSSLLDGVLQAYFPSYSTLSIISIFVLAIQLLINLTIRPLIYPSIIISWFFLSLLLFCYPFLGLALERAPLRAYLVIISGPIFILWRSWLALISQTGGKKVVWVRTTHGAQSETKKST